MFEDLIAREIVRLKLEEGVVDHLYLDTRGNVTVGVGFLLPHVADAQRLPFLTRSLHLPATVQQIASDYAAVLAMLPGLPAAHYLAATFLCLDSIEIDKLLGDELDQTIARLQQEIVDFPLLPEACQEALVDMEYNLGMRGLLKYHSLLASIARGDWTACAQQCHRRGISDERNRDTAALFEGLIAPEQPVLA